MNKENRIDYVEFPARDLDKAEAFYGTVFGWTFEDYGPNYRAFNDGRIDGGFYLADVQADWSSGSALIVFYSTDLEGLQKRVVENGATVSKEIFSFPGGRRFHFKDLNGNELAAWSNS